MDTITKVSEITYETLAEYIRLNEVTENDQAMLNTLLGVAKSYIKSYTGHTEEELDNYPDFIQVVFLLCQDMWDTRTMYVGKSNLNKAVDTILGMHSVNLLPQEDESASND